MTSELSMKTCPICGKKYTGYPAVSRTDNKTEICPDCGYRQALTAAGIKPEVQEAILAQIHQSEHHIQTLRERFPDEDEISELEKKYQPGTRIRLIKMVDDINPVPAGTLGTVDGVDSTGSLLVTWDNGRSLNVLYGIDEVEIVK